MRQRLDNTPAWGMTIVSKWKLQALTLTLGGAYVINANGPPALNLDPGGAGRDVTLPAVEEGLMFLINNAADAAEDITVKNPAAATIGTISQNEAGLAVCFGGVWYLRLVGTST